MLCWYRKGSGLTRIVRPRLRIRRAVLAKQTCGMIVGVVRARRDYETLATVGFADHRLLGEDGGAKL